MGKTRKIKYYNTFKVLQYISRKLVEALRYKSEGRGFDPRWCLSNSLTYSFGRTMALGPTQPLTVVSARVIYWVPMVDNMAIVCRLSRYSGSFIFLEPSWPADKVFFF